MAHPETHVSASPKARVAAPIDPNASDAVAKVIDVLVANGFVAPAGEVSDRAAGEDLAVEAVNAEAIEVAAQAEPERQPVEDEVPIVDEPEIESPAEGVEVDPLTGTAASEGEPVPFGEGSTRLA